LKAYTDRLRDFAARVGDLDAVEAQSALIAAVAVRKELEAFFEPVTRSAYQAHKRATAARDSVLKPVKKAEDALRERVSEVPMVEDEESSAIVPAAVEGLPGGRVIFKKRRAVRVTDEKKAIAWIANRGGASLNLLSIDKRNLRHLVDSLGDIHIPGVEVEEVIEPAVRLE